MREQVYKDPRPAEYFDRFHERSRTREPDAIYEVIRVFTSLLAWTFFRTRQTGAEKVPFAGPVILAANHSSFMDHFFIGAFLRRRVRFMAKSQLFRPPLEWVFTHGGAFPVRRGARDEQAFQTAQAILDGGAAIVMYLEGGRSRTGTLSDKPKRGAGRLALQSGAPVVPVALYGAERARNWKRGHFPHVKVAFGDPIRFEGDPDPALERQQETADEIYRRIKDLYGELSGR